MSYWDDAQTCLNELMSKGSMAITETQRQHALRMVNLLHTDPNVKGGMMSMYKLATHLGDCRKKLLNSANAGIFQTGPRKKMASGTKLIHLATSSSINGLTGSVSQIADDFKDGFDTYIASRISQKRSLWIAENCNAATTFDGICKVARELGLYHFGFLLLDQPIVAFHLRTTRAVEAIKPSWAHAFDNWYFDPWPEGSNTLDVHGKARCLDTGQLLRSEWVVHPDDMGSALEVVNVYLSHEVDEIRSMPDFNALGASYWPTTDARVNQLQKVVMSS
jgi:hypothetical protein